MGLKIRHCEDDWYHSDETRGSRGVRRSWREFCSLVRRWVLSRSGFRERRVPQRLQNAKPQSVGHPRIMALPPADGKITGTQIYDKQ